MEPTLAVSPAWTLPDYVPCRTRAGSTSTRESERPPDEGSGCARRGTRTVFQLFANTGKSRRYTQSDPARLPVRLSPKVKVCATDAPTFQQSGAFQPHSPSRGRGSSVFCTRSLPERNSRQRSISRPLPQRTEGPLSAFRFPGESRLCLLQEIASVPTGALYDQMIGIELGVDRRRKANFQPRTDVPKGHRGDPVG
jgi:hypothetical protein